MRKTLGHHHRIWLPLLLLITGFHRRRYVPLYHDNDVGSHSRDSLAQFSLFAFAQNNQYNPRQDDAWDDWEPQPDLPRCQETRCLPGGCYCGLPPEEANTCATNYGAWGWRAPEDSEAPVWKRMPVEYDLKYGAIKPVGMRGGNRETGIGRGIGRIANITNTTLTGEVYFEMHPSQLSKNTGYNPPDLMVELYGKVDFGLSDCDEGIMLGHRLVNMSGYDDAVSNFEYFVTSFEDYNEVFANDAIECHPRSVNGALGAVVFTLNDPFYYHEQSASIMNLWYPFRQNVEFGSMEFCIRLEVVDRSWSSSDDDFTDDYFKKRKVTSYVDTKFKVEVSEPNPANNFTRYQDGLSEIKIYSNQPIGPTDETADYLPLRYDDTPATESPTLAPTVRTQITVPIQTFLCSAPDESDVKGKFDPDRTFRHGQTFRLCVGPVPGKEKEHTVVGFKSVVCENNGRNKTLVDEFGIPDEYTTINTNAMGFTMKKGGIVTSTRVISLNSVINADLAGIFPEGQDFFLCAGYAILEATPEAMGSGGEGAETMGGEEGNGKNGNVDSNGEDDAAASALEKRAAGSHNRTSNRKHRRQSESEDHHEPKDNIFSRRLRIASTTTSTNRTSLRQSRIIQRTLPPRRNYYARTSPFRRLLQPAEPNSTRDEKNATNDEETLDELLDEIEELSGAVASHGEGIALVGILRARIDLTTGTFIAKVDGAVTGAITNAVNTVAGWFQISSAGRGVSGSIAMALGASVVVSLVLLA